MGGGGVFHGHDLFLLPLANYPQQMYLFFCIPYKNLTIDLRKLTMDLLIGCHFAFKENCNLCSTKQLK